MKEAAIKNLKKKTDEKRKQKLSNTKMEKALEVL